MELVSDKNMHKKSNFVSAIDSVSVKDKANKLFLKAEKLRNKNEFALSVTEYLKAIFLDRNNISNLIGIALSYKNMQNYEKALKYFEKAKKFGADSFELYYNLGIVQLVLNMPESAVENLRKAIMLDKTNLNAQLQLAIAHELMSEPNMAEMIYQKIIEQNPDFLAAYNHKASLLMNFEDYANAASLFNNILKINPDFYRAYFGIAVCFDKLGKNQEAIRYYKKFLANRPNTINIKKIFERINDLKANAKTIRPMPQYLSLV